MDSNENEEMVRDGGSFRDPSGFVWKYGGKIYRQINPSYFEYYRMARQSGIYEDLWSRNQLIAHREVEDLQSHKTLELACVPFVSYPYEWSFSQIKDAALLTLGIQKKVLEKNFILKDASIFNVQFLNGHPVFIDTLSFEPYVENEPWVAFSQFCRHFLYPLILMSTVDLRLNNLFKIWIDGIPLDLAKHLLSKNFFSLNYWLYVKLPFLSQKKGHARKERTESVLKKKRLLGLLDGLSLTVQGLRAKRAATEWGDYYTFTNYSPKAFEYKREWIVRFLKKIGPKSVWDLGANDGHFSACAGEMGIPTVALDIDPIAVEKHYLDLRQRPSSSILPLLMDLTNPSPSLGWGHGERKSLQERGPVDLCLCLALIHHLAIGNNVPFHSIAAYFATLCQHLVVEFIPKEDTQVQKLLLNRKDVFEDYNTNAFEDQFSKHFALIEKEAIRESVRVLYLFKRL